MTVEFNCKRVANLLKHIVNQGCEPGFKWYEDVNDDFPTMFDINHAIKVLDNIEPGKIEVLEE